MDRGMEAQKAGESGEMPPGGPMEEVFSRAVLEGVILWPWKS